MGAGGPDFENITVARMTLLPPSLVAVLSLTTAAGNAIFLPSFRRCVTAERADGAGFLPFARRRAYRVALAAVGMDVSAAFGKR